MFFLKLTSSVGQSNDAVNYAFDRIAYYQEIGDVEGQVCEMMNTESLLSEMNLNQAEKGQYYMSICLTQVDLSTLKKGSETLGRAQEYKGIRHYVNGEFDLAVASFDKSLEILSDYGYQYRIHRWLGVIHCLSEQLSEGISHYEDAITHAVKYYGEQDPQGNAFIFSLHSNVTSAYAKIENFRKARYHAHKALDYAKKITDKSLIATATINEANILINEKKAEEALEVLSGLDTIITDRMQVAANYYNILGTAYQQTKNYDLSIQNFKRSNALISKESVLHESVVLNLLAIGEAQYLKDDFENALKTTQNVIQNLEKKKDQYSSSLADAYHLKAKCLIELNRYNNAEVAIQKALDIEGPFETWKLPQLSSMISLKAAQYQKTKDNIHLEDLLKYQAQVDSLILDLQVKHRHYEDEVNLNEYIYNAYSNNLTVIKNLKNDSPSLFGPQMVFKYMETLKSFGLRNERKAQISGLNISSELLNQVSELKYSLIKHQKDRYELQQSNQNTKQIDSLYASTKYEYYAVLDILETEYPQYYKGQYQTINPDLAKVQNRLRPEEAIIEYFLSDATIHIIGITTDTLFSTSTPKPKNWASLVAGFRRSVSDIDYVTNPDNYQEVFELFTQNAQLLHEVILDDITDLLPSSIKDLKIIPDNELYYIPFELLLTANSSADSYQEQKYLALKYNISYSESTEYLFQSEGNNFDEAYTVIAPDYTSAKTNLDQIQHSYRTAKIISDRFNGSIINTDTEAKNYLTSNPSTEVLHFAGHAGITEDPSLSNLMLSEGAIYTADIYQSEIENQLTILSACNTGNGDFINGRGLQSLSRAFRFAGAQSTIQSLWPVPDLQTSKINNNVISNLESGMRIQDALQEAKFNLLNESPRLYSHPFYWAGFVAFGSTEQVMSLESHTNYPQWITWLLITIVLILFGTLLFRKSKNS